MFHTRRKTNNYRNSGLLLLLASFFLFFLSIYTGLFILFFVAFGFLLGTIPLFREYKIWRSGAKGEETTAKQLKSLKGKYHVFHEVMLPRTKGDIDHIAIGPNGIFVIETKNNNGTIRCNGDSWSQLKTGKKGGRYKGKIGRPSRQAKRNANLLANLIGRRLHRRFHVNALVVFANKKAVLDLNHPTVPVLHAKEVCRFIENFGSRPLSTKEQDRLANLIAPYSQY
jgi:hypothetical protein